ncbi:MAG TPA: hypothetical protein VF482_18645, partial [Trebonia sp.]
ERLHLHGVALGRPAGDTGVTIVLRERGEAEAADAERLGRDLAARMLARGAANLMGARTDRDDAHD